MTQPYIDALQWYEQPFPWYVSGPLIALVMIALLLFGKNFGVSANLRTFCAIGGGGRYSNFFRIDWRSQVWNLLFAGGALLGGWLSQTFLMGDYTPAISAATQQDLQALGIAIEPGFLPSSIYNWESLQSPIGWIFIVLGGFLIGFGTRYAGGCTSGHAISGLSDLQIPSLVAVIGFFLGGLLMTHVLMPIIFA